MKKKEPVGSDDSLPEDLPDLQSLTADDLNVSNPQILINIFTFL